MPSTEKELKRNLRLANLSLSMEYSSKTFLKWVSGKEEPKLTLVNLILFSNSMAKECIAIPMVKCTRENSRMDSDTDGVLIKISPLSTREIGLTGEKTRAPSNTSSQTKFMLELSMRKARKIAE